LQHAYQPVAAGAVLHHEDDVVAHFMSDHVVDEHEGPRGDACRRRQVQLRHQVIVFQVAILADRLQADLPGFTRRRFGV